MGLRDPRSAQHRQRSSDKSLPVHHPNEQRSWNRRGRRRSRALWSKRIAASWWRCGDAEVAMCGRSCEFDMRLDWQWIDRDDSNPDSVSRLTQRIHEDEAAGSVWPCGCAPWSSRSRRCGSLRTPRPSGSRRPGPHAGTWRGRWLRARRGAPLRTQPSPDRRSVFRRGHRHRRPRR